MLPSPVRMSRSGSGRLWVSRCEEKSFSVKLAVVLSFLMALNISSRPP